MNVGERAVAIAREAIAGVDLAARVRAAMPPLPPARARVTACAIGKAAPVMMRAAIERWSSRIARAVVVTTKGTDVDALRGLTTNVEVMFAAHPLPDERSLAAAEAMLEAVRGDGKDLALVLVSGGASSLASAPTAGLSLARKRAVIEALLSRGADIADLDVVRKHLSSIKGGGLARAAFPGRTLTLVVSDVLRRDANGAVISGDPSDVGSGPGTPDGTSIEDARAILTRLSPELLDELAPFLATSLPLDDLRARRARTKLVASPLDLAERARLAAEGAGLAVRVLAPSLAHVEALADEYVALSSTLRPGQACVRVAEPSVPTPSSRGRGGRAGRLALLAHRRGLAPDVALACVASDGVDGSSGNAGAVVVGPAARATHAAIDDALHRYDDAAFLESNAFAIRSLPTGTNLLDVHVLVRL